MIKSGGLIRNAKRQMQIIIDYETFFKYISQNPSGALGEELIKSTVVQMEWKVAND